MWTVTLVRKNGNIIVRCEDRYDAWVVGGMLADACGSVLEVCPSNKMIMVPDGPDPLPASSVPASVPAMT